MALTSNQVGGIIDVLAPLGAELEMEKRSYDVVGAPITDGGVIGGDTAISAIAVADVNRYPNGARVVAAYLTPSVAVTGADATAKTITLTSLTSAGASSLTVGTIVTNLAGGNYAANQSKAFTLTAANTIVPAGGSIQATMTHAGVGMAIASATGAARLTIVLQAL